MNKKITSTIIAALMIAGSTSFTAFAAMSNGSIVIGSKAFSLDYANDPINAKEISAEIVQGGVIYVKNFDGNWINNLTGLTVDTSLIPAVVFKNASGTTNFDAQDKDTVVDGTSKVASVSLNKTVDNLTVGKTDTLTIAISPSDSANKAVIWTSSNTNVATAINGIITAVSFGTTTITVTTADGNKVASCAITVDNKKGYVHNTDLSINLNVRSSASLSGIILGALFNYEKIEILGTTVDTSGNVWDKINYNNSIAYVSDAYIIPYTTPSDDVVSVAENITKQFEVGVSNQVAGNSDGQGLSLGYLQWCIGEKTLQPILNRMDMEYNSEMKSIFEANYDAIHNMILDTPSSQVVWANSINNYSNNIIEPWNTTFASLCKNADFKNIEDDAQIYTVNQAMIICDLYNLKTVRGFALAYDIANQNGGLSQGAIKIIGDARSATPNMTEKNLLAVIANAVADSSTTNSADVLARKMAIVSGKGTVHNILIDLDTNFGLSDTNWR